MVERKSKRRAFDYYPTPAWCTTRLFEVPEFVSHLDRVERILEPFAGDGAILRVLAKRLTGVQLEAWEIQDRFREPIAHAIKDVCALPITIRIGDSFDRARGKRFDLVITNPPNFAIERALRVFARKSIASAFFLPLSRLAGKKNGEVHDKHPPSIVQVLRTRPKFTGNGRSGFLDYAWFIYLPGWEGDTIVRWARAKKRGTRG